VLRIRKSIKKTQNVYKKAQKICRYSGAGVIMAMLLCTNAVVVNIANSKAVTQSDQPKTMTMGASTPTAEGPKTSEQQWIHGTYPHELILCYEGKGGRIDSKTRFSVCTINQNSSVSELYKLLPLPPEYIPRIGVWNSDKNPDIRLCDFPMIGWKKLWENSKSSINYDAAVCLSNTGKKPLHVSLPHPITMPLFIFGNNVVLENHISAESVFIGVDGRKIPALSSGCPFYADHLVDSTVTINGELEAKGPYYIAQSSVTFNGFLPKDLTLYDARILVKNTGKDDFTKKNEIIKCYSYCSLDFEGKMGQIKGNVLLGSRDEPFRTDPSGEPNDSSVHLHNVFFQPKTIDIALPSTDLQSKSGLFNITEGFAMLQDTDIRLMWRSDSITPDILGHRMLIISSDRPIIGIPCVSIKCAGEDLRLQARIEIDGHKAYVVLTKGPNP
jgi:hypothetical protein